VGAVSTPPRDQWVTVTGSFTDGGGDPPVLAATALEEIDPPEDPYE